MSTPDNQINPPKWPLKFLRFFLKKEYLEEIEGDMYEIFLDNAEQYSLSQAKRIYTWEMLKLLRPSLIRNLKGINSPIQLPMFKNYFKTSMRGLMKTPLSSFINITGLAMAIGICVFAYAFAQYTLRTDQFHVNKETVFLVTFMADRDGSLQQYGQTPRPLGEILKEDFAHVRKVCRVEDRNVVVKHDDNVFHERVRFTDAAFLEMLTFPLKWGTSNSLSDLSSVILSEKMAEKYFGEKNPIGESILLRFDQQHNKMFKVTGVADKFPESRSMDFGFLINFENLKLAEADYDSHDWRELTSATFIMVDNPSAIPYIQNELDKYRSVQNKAVHHEWSISSFSLEPLATLHKKSGGMKNVIARSSLANYTSIIFIGVIAALLMALACFNYINIAIASAAKRLKEIGVRKTIGASRRLVIVQFLTENILLTFLALFVGMILAGTIFIPGFESMWNFSMGFKLLDTALWIYLPCILLITAIASGLYPAVFISKFHVISILKGSVRFGKKNPLTKIFLALQLILACMFITTAVLFVQNNSYLSNRSWGYHQESALYVNVPDGAAYENLYAVIVQDPNVLSISGSTNHLGKNHTSVTIQMPGRQYEVDQLAVDQNYIQTMGIELMNGRNFKDHSEADRQSVIVNEEFVRSLFPDQSREHAIGKVFKIDSTQYDIIAVARNFHNYNFDHELRPIMLKRADKNDFHYLSMRVRPGTKEESYKSLQQHWSKMFPEIPFQGGYQEDVWPRYFESLDIFAIVWKVFATIAVLLAGLGLYGLITLNVTGRVKEFSIRKVLGAGIQNLASLIAGQYLILLSISLVIAAPLSYWFGRWIVTFAFTYHRPIDVTPVLISISILCGVLLLAISSQMFKVGKANPLIGLKTE
jgi:putative ABC transport system permease protein